MYDLNYVNPDAMRAELEYRHGLLAADARPARPRGLRRTRRHHHLTLHFFAQS
jgi:hypothetical protein